MKTPNAFSLLFKSQLRSFGLNPFEWHFDTWVCLKEKSFMLHHREDNDFKLKGCLARERDDAGWSLSSLAIVSV